MKRIVLSLLMIAGLCTTLTLTSGCVSRADYDKLVRRNTHCNERVEELLAAQENQRLTAEQWQQKIDTLNDLSMADKQKIKALLATLEAKQALIEQLTDQVGQPALPVELSSALADWAKQSGSDLVTYDEKNGMVRFKSDLLFDKGSDNVQATATTKIEALSKILVSVSAIDYDILIVGHTDDIPILKPDTLVKHPTNWHLSAHRAIAVEKILTAAGVASGRVAVIGMGEYHPIEPNAAGKKGNPKNRRVEIYIVPAGRFAFTANAVNPAPVATMEDTK